MPFSSLVALISPIMGKYSVLRSTLATLICLSSQAELTRPRYAGRPGKSENIPCLLRHVANQAPQSQCSIVWASTCKKWHARYRTQVEASVYAPKQTHPYLAIHLEYP